MIREYNIVINNDFNLMPEPSIYHIDIGSMTLSIYVKPNPNSDKLYVFSPGYLERTKFEHPYFQRMKWLDDIDANGIIITDPTLSVHSDIGISWFQGDKDNFALAKIARIIDSLRVRLKVSRSNTLFYGSSAGGFASLMLSSMVKDSCCVVNNPQTEVLNFRESFVSAMLKRCYDCNSRYELDRLFETRLSVADFFIKNNNIPKCIFVQNICDVEHYNDHMLPLLKKLGQHFNTNEGSKIFENFIIKLYANDAAGHNPAVFNFIKKYFDMAEKEFFQS